MSEHNSGIHTAKEIVQVIGDGVALASSPALIEILFLLNALGIYTKGFSGYRTNQSAPPYIDYNNPSVRILNP